MSAAEALEPQPLNPPARVYDCRTCDGRGELHAPATLERYDTVECNRCGGTGEVEVPVCGRRSCGRTAVHGVHDRGVNLCARHLREVAR